MGELDCSLGGGSGRAGMQEWRNSKRHPPSPSSTWASVAGTQPFGYCFVLLGAKERKNEDGLAAWARGKEGRGSHAERRQHLFLGQGFPGEDALLHRLVRGFWQCEATVRSALVPLNGVRWREEFASVRLAFIWPGGLARGPRLWN